MEDLNKSFWVDIRSKYPDELQGFIDYIFDKLTTGNSNTYRIDRDGILGTPGFVMFGLFVGYTMEHEHKQDWFRTKNHGSVTEQISRWFEVEHRRSLEPMKFHSAYPAFL